MDDFDFMQEYFSPEQRAYIDEEADRLTEAYADAPPIERLRAAMLLQNDALKELSVAVIKLNLHYREHCEQLQEARDRIEFLEQMLVQPEDPQCEEDETDGV